ncbi:MAG: DUF2723 domain-containing protein [Calditrichaceae bacterium]
MEKINRIVAAVIFIFTAVIYTMTVAPTVSFWDCGEFIACSYKMAVPHPPGAPLYLLIGRIFTLIPLAKDIALRVNMISVFSSALTIMLLYLIIVHLVRQWKGKLTENIDWYTAIFSGVIGALSFAFSHSIWFNSAEAEVYAPSMLFTALIVWLIMVWATKSDEPGSDRYLLMIAYLIGLSIGVHLLNILALPFITMIYYYKRYEFNAKSFGILVVLTGIIMIAVYPGMVKWIPLFALDFGAVGLALLFVTIIFATFWAVNNHKHLLSFIFLSIFLITIGYSSYATIFIRSNLNPNIDENNPETVENFIKYINREQYGDHSIVDRKEVWKTSPNGRRYDSTLDFFWNYQINHMYVRYFLWQFVGMSDDETDWNFQLWGIPFLLGLLGIYWHYRKDPKHALAVTALFFMTGLAIILYLNQPDPQPRERDYSYVGSFFAFSIWIGLGYAGLIDLIKTSLSKNNEKLKLSTIYLIFFLLLIISPMQMLAKNFHSHNRSGNYVAWDYSYNMLISCEPNAILFTNGDNDTFPLWYLQEVENVRTDVRIVNLSLLNTDWYIRQLRDMDPKVPMNMSDMQLDRLGLIPWKAQTVTVDVPNRVAEKMSDEFASAYPLEKENKPDKISFRVNPALNTRYGPMLRTQDYMILNILAANRWRKPIYFAVTVPRSNMVSELVNYMRMDGLVMKIVPYKDWHISPSRLKENLTQKYQYRGLDDKSVYFNDNIKNLLQNYRSGYFQLAEYYSNQGEESKILDLWKNMDKNVDPDVIPWTSRGMRVMSDAVEIAADTTLLDSIAGNYKDIRDLQILGEQLLRLDKPKSSIPVLESVLEENPNDPRAMGLLLRAYESAGEPEKAVKSLESWIELNPGDRRAKQRLDELKRELEK